MTIMQTIALVLFGVSALSTGAAILGWKRAGKHKADSARKSAKIKAMEERNKERAAALEEQRQKLKESRDYRKKLKEATNDESASAAIDDFFARVERL